jgi:hypothetical protein
VSATGRRLVYVSGRATCMPLPKCSHCLPRGISAFSAISATRFRLSGQRPLEAEALGQKE